MHGWKPKIKGEHKIYGQRSVTVPVSLFLFPPLPLLTDLVGLHESGESHVVLPHREEGLHHERVVGLGAGTHET